MERILEEFSLKLEKISRFENGISLLLLCIISLISFNFTNLMNSTYIRDTGIRNVAMVNNKNSELENITVVIDPGHGGVDPGKIGRNNMPEKDINLGISLKMKKILKDKGFNAVMTRDKDEGLYEETDSNKKIADMRRRCELINNEYIRNGNVICVSIHQNSYPDERVCGPQVFYYSKSREGSRLAEIMQRTINDKMNVERPRNTKANDNYFLLINTDCPTVIVECGFLSNPKEAAKLCEKDYQNKIADAVVEGISRYFSAKTDICNQ
ncbi:MAG: N-acetylmuramoyl-L-alanine amidase [Lachnospiraceae bacterium]|nr:N-acetylmuramoyl-L-alanine amidase [Lachnospiraceae bacterium]